MEALETINKVFAHNLRELRGSRTQSDVAEQIDMPLRTYQHLEAGKIPKTRKYLAALAEFHDVSEPRLFLDPDLIKKEIEKRSNPAENSGPGGLLRAAAVVVSAPVGVEIIVALAELSAKDQAQLSIVLRAINGLLGPSRDIAKSDNSHNRIKRG